MVRSYHADEIPAVYNLDEMPVESREKSSRRYFRGLDTLVGINRIEPGRDSSPHSHPWEQINFVLEGSCRFHVDGEVISIREGDFFVVPPDVPHCSEPGDDPCTIIFTGPIREDSLDKTAYQTELVRYEHEE